MDRKRDQMWSKMFEVEFDRRVVSYLTVNHPGYQELLKKRTDVLNQYPVLDRLWDQDGEISLTEEEHRAFGKYLKIKSDLEALEREYHYFLGQTDMRDLDRLMNHLSAEGKTADADQRKLCVMEHLVSERLGEAEKEFLENEEFRQRREHADRLGKELSAMELPEHCQSALDEYVSAVEAEWLCYGELAYRCGMEDLLAILRQ